MTELLYNDNTWTFERLEKAMEEIEIIAKEELWGNYYPVQIEIVDSQEMLNLYSSNAMPLMYSHWSFGKDNIINTRNYNHGQMGLAFEIIQNLNPCVGYLMDTNSMTMQVLVLAHALIGHNLFFANNYLFKEWTDAASILDYMIFAKKYIAECEEKYGYEKVEELLDCCHSLQMHGVDKYKRPHELSVAAEEALLKERQEEKQREINVLWNSTIYNNKPEIAKETKNFPEEPEENLLFFIENFSPVLEPWEREIVRIVRKLGQYWYPNMQTKTINEGFACFSHYYIFNRLWEKKLVSDGSYLEFIKSHTAVCFQPDYNEVRYLNNGMVVPIFSGINPYALGFEMFMDIKRICEDPTPEDREWFPNIAGSDWRKTIKHVYENYRDESFILQYLSPALIRKWKFFLFSDAGDDDEVFEVEKIHDDSGYREIRRRLSKLYDFNTQIPNMAVWNVDMKGSRKLELRHFSHDEIPLSKGAMGALKNFAMLWGFDVVMKSVDIQTGQEIEKIELTMPKKISK